MANSPTGGFDTPQGVAVDKAGNILVTNSTYNVGNATSNALSVVNPSTGAIIQNITLGGTLAKVAADPNSGVAYVTVSSGYSGSGGGAAGLWAVNPETGAKLWSVSLGASNPQGVAVDPNNGTIYVSQAGANHLAIINPTTHAVTIAGGGSPYGFGGNPQDVVVADNGMVYVTGQTLNVVTAYNPVTDTVSSQWATGALGTSDLAIQKAGPYAGDLYVTAQTSGKVVVMDPTDGHIVTTINGVTGATAIAIAPAGAPNAGTVYVTNGLSSPGKVFVIDPNTNQSVGSFTGTYCAPLACTAGNPNAIAVSSDGTIWVPNSSGDSNMGIPVTQNLTGWKPGQ